MKFRTNIILTILLLLAISLSYAFNESPNVFYKDGKFQVFSVIDSTLKTELLSDEILQVPVSEDSYKEVKLQNNFRPQISTEKNIEKFFIASDIHGQNQSFIKVLQNAEVIDEDLNWIFEKGCLVIVGDIFDRGPEVTENIWLLYYLWQEAEKAGGKVKITYGNHERMVLYGDERYVHQKYSKTAELMNKSIKEMYNEDSLFGRWFRSFNVILKLNNSLFVHGGISPEFIELDFKIDEVNEIFRKNIDLSREEYAENETLKFLFHGNGPIWYRGFFNKERKKENVLTNAQIDSILSYFSVERIFVGHTTFDKILKIYDNKIIGVDAGLKYGDDGSGILIENSDFMIIDR